jgi:hypothetical protein
MLYVYHTGQCNCVRFRCDLLIPRLCNNEIWKDYIPNGIRCGNG